MCCKVGESGVACRHGLTRPRWLGSSHSATSAESHSLPRRPWTGISETQLAFRGHFDYSLDAKNRLTVPPKFRVTFSSGIVLAKGLEPCIALWTPDAFE